MAERISEKKKIEDAFDGQSSYQLHRASIHRNEINVMYENPLFDGITKIESDDNKKRKNNNNIGMFRKHPKLSTWICTFLVALISILYILYIALQIGFTQQYKNANSSLYYVGFICVACITSQVKMVNTYRDMMYKKKIKYVIHIIVIL